MGRSISTPSNAAAVCYSVIDDNQFGDEFDMLMDDFRDQLFYMFPSVTSTERWLGREDHVLAENGLAMFGMSEYCGLIAYWIVPQEHSHDGRLDGIAKRWIEQIAPKFTKAFGELTKVGTASNGESFYQRNAA